MAEGLTPVYKMGNETDPKKWSGIVGDASTKYCGPSSSNSIWNTMSFDASADGYRLPTEAEWEYMARGENKKSYTYSGSDTIGDVAWYGSNSKGKTHEVKTKNSNTLGIYDMTGNVREWCWDWYGSISSSTSSAGASSGSVRVSRGASWSFTVGYCGVYRRDEAAPECRGSNFGFRVVRSSSE